ncbi:MAG: hypothetical protein H6824_13220 [Planctomycetaceae bacterium]|nr:hypothetical protein [Planctomycetaceae bacterium]
MGIPRSSQFARLAFGAVVALLLFSGCKEKVVTTHRDWSDEYESEGKLQSVNYYVLPTENYHFKDDWIQEVAESEPVRAKEIVLARFTGVKTLPSIKMRDYLCSLDVTEAVYCTEGELEYIGLILPGQSRVDTTAVYLPPIVNGDDLGKLLAANGITENDELLEFCLNFQGIAEEPLLSGDILPIVDGKLRILDDEYSFVPGFEDWKGAVCLFWARNYDQLYVRSDGKIAWLCNSAGEFRTSYDDIGAFVDFYIQFRQAPRILDSYAAADFEKQFPK